MMQFGITFPQNEIGTDPIAIRDFAQAVEGAGLDYLATYEHVTGAPAERFAGVNVGFPAPPYLDDAEFHEPFILFSYLAGLTSRLQFATGILILPQRQTALVAKQAAALDIISGGRFRLGVGVGWNFTEYEALNEDFHTRGRRQEEQIIVMRKLWTEPLVTFEGKWHKFDRIGISPRPSRPIPIWIGGGASDQVLRRVARLADGWIPGGLPAGDETDRIIARLQGFIREEGRNVSSFGLQASIGDTSGPPAAWISNAKRLQALGTTHLGLGGAARGATPAQLLSHAVRVKSILDQEIG